MPPKAQFMQKWHSPWHPMIKPRYKVINRDQPSPIRTRRIKNQVKSELYKELKKSQNKWSIYRDF